MELGEDDEFLAFGYLIEGLHEHLYFILLTLHIWIYYAAALLNDGFAHGTTANIC